MKRELEALLFATDSPLTLTRLKKLFPGVETAEIKSELTALEGEYQAAGHAFMLVEFGGGWQISTRPEFSPIVEKMLKGRRFTRLSKAGLEVLAIIAYRQPITRLDVDEIRGVNSAGAISTLSERNLISVVGRSQTVGNPLLYGTTREFLNYLGLKGLGQLPDLPDLEALGRVVPRVALGLLDAERDAPAPIVQLENLDRDRVPGLDRLGHVGDPRMG